MKSIFFIGLFCLASFLMHAQISVSRQVVQPVLAERELVEQEVEVITLPQWNIKTNLLYGATATANLGVEFRTGFRTSFELPFSYNAWDLSNNKKWRHVLVQPEFRFWTRQTFRGHFLGLHGHYAFFNAGALPTPPFSEYMHTHRFQGWLAGGGLSYGYRWNFNHRWALEATIGGGFAQMEYDRFLVDAPLELLDVGSRLYWGPTKVGVSFIYGFGGRRMRETVMVEMPSTPFIPTPSITPAPSQSPFAPTFALSYIIPDAESSKSRLESGSVFLDFSQRSTQIDPNFRNNAAELQRMQTKIDQLIRDPHSTVTNIHIIGNASIEGTYADNMVLSERRAISLRNWLVARNPILDNKITTRGAGENWAKLDSLVAASSMLERNSILEIIRGVGVFDGRERMLMDLNGGIPYRQMAAQFFPYLRRVDFILEYAVPSFDIETAKAVYRTRPGNLSLNELFLIAKTYNPQSDEFKEVIDLAVRLFPDCDVANLNAASSALERRDLPQATHFLERVKIPNEVYWNNLAILQYYRNEYESAMGSFRRSGATGAENMAEFRKYLESLN